MTSPPPLLFVPVTALPSGGAGLTARRTPHFGPPGYYRNQDLAVSSSAKHPPRALCRGQIMAPRAEFSTEQIRGKARKDLLYLLEGVSKAHCR